MNSPKLAEYIAFTSVSVVFYCENQDGSFEFLLTTTDKGEEGQRPTYQEIREPIIEADVTGIITAARIMVQKFRGCFSQSNIEKLANGEKLIESDLLSESLNNYELWNHPLFFEAIRVFLQSNHTMELEDGRLILFVKLPKFDTEDLNESLKDVSFNWFSDDSLKDSKQTDSELSQLASEYDFASFIGSLSPLGSDEGLKKDTFIILSCKPVDRSTAVDPMYLHFPALFQGIFKRSGEKWIHYNAANDEFPTEEQMKSVRAIIIPGSSSSIYDKHEGIDKLKHWIKDFDVKYPKVKMLGICFGAQAICESLGGKVDKMEPRKSDPDYYLVTSQVLEPTDDFYKLPYVKKVLPDKSKRLCVVEAHGDEIKKLPRGFRNLVSSKTCKNEFIVSESGRYLAIQGHPEYSAEFIAGKMISVDLTTGSKTEASKKFEADKRDILKTRFKDLVTSDSMRGICYAFLKQ